MKIFKIPVIWQMWGIIKIEAKGLKEAKEKAFEGGLPVNGSYIDDSFEIDGEGIPIHNKGLKNEKH